MILRVHRTREETRGYYNRISSFYDLLAEKSEAPAKEMGLKLLSPQSGEKILEIGFGTGHSLVSIAECVGTEGKVYGIEISDKMVVKATSRLKQLGLYQRTELRCGDALPLPYSTHFFDGIFMSFTLELFDTPDIPKILAECRRTLKEKGRFCVVGMQKAESLAVRAYESLHKHFPSIVDCRPIYVEQSVEEAGFVIREKRQFTHWVPMEIVLAI